MKELFWEKRIREQRNEHLRKLRETDNGTLGWAICIAAVVLVWYLRYVVIASW